MGCAQSRIDNEESVSRCKDRKILMKDAVVARNAFASGHSGYAVALKNTGAALSDYGHGETEETTQLHHLQQPLDSTSEPPPPPPPPIDNLPPPPPPLPNFSPSPIILKRATSMPEIPMKLGKPGRVIDSITIAEEDEEEDNEVDGEESGKGLRRSRGSRNGVEEMGSEVTPSPPPRTPEMKLVPPMPESKGMAWDYFFMMDNMAGSSLSGEDESRGENDGHVNMEFGEAENLAVGGGNLDDGVEPKTPEKVEEKPEETPVRQIEHSHTAPSDFRRAVKAASSVSLMQVLNQIDDHFLKASESAQEVSKMLEATRLHYHSNFADNRGMHICFCLLLNGGCDWEFLETEVPSYTKKSFFFFPI